MPEEATAEEGSVPRSVFYYCKHALLVKLPHVFHALTPLEECFFLGGGVPREDLLKGAVLFTHHTQNALGLCLIAVDETLGPSGTPPSKLRTNHLDTPRFQARSCQFVNNGQCYLMRIFLRTTTE
jgi:hypothetical protein